MLTKDQKAKMKLVFQLCKNVLLGMVPERDEKGILVKPKVDKKFEALDPKLGIHKKWDLLIEILDKEIEETAARTPLEIVIGKETFSGHEIICKIMEWKCDLLKGRDYFQPGQECPEYVTKFCCLFPKEVNNPFWQAVLQRKCMRRLAYHMLKHGELVDYLRPVTRECPLRCTVYEECVSPRIPLELRSQPPPYDPGSVWNTKLVYDQFNFCMRHGEEITKLTIQKLDEMIAMCE